MGAGWVGLSTLPLTPVDMLLVNAPSLASSGCTRRNESKATVLAAVSLHRASFEQKPLFHGPHGYPGSEPAYAGPTPTGEKTLAVRLVILPSRVVAQAAADPAAREARAWSMAPQGQEARARR